MTFMQINKETYNSVQNKILLMKLFKLSKQNKNASLPHFSAKLTLRRKHYPELEIFKQQIEDEYASLHLPFYAFVNKRIFSYRLVFFGLSLFFLALLGIVYLQSAGWTYALAFGASWTQLKWVICSLCAALSAAAFYFGMSLSQAKESACTLTIKAKKTLQRLHNRKCIELGILSYISFGEEHRKKVALRQVYLEMIDTIHEHHEETLRLLERIARVDTESENQERLFNQAISAFYDQLTYVIQTFKHLNIETTLLFP
jgi:hypothetical protein